MLAKEYLNGKEKSYEKSFSKRERIYLMLYLVISPLLCIFFLWLAWLMVFLDNSVIFIVMSCFNILIVLQTLMLMCKMSKMHRYEYERTRSAYTYQVLGILLFIGSGFYLYPNHWKYTCAKNFEYHIYNTQTIAGSWRFFIEVPIRFWVHLLLYFYVIIYVKSPMDILQGISKFDNLKKVSIFQEFKGVA
jgi:hypothetical protein